jgi:hypothetical protein
MAAEAVGRRGVVDLADVAGVELGGVKGALLDRAAAEAVALGLVAAERAVLEVAVADRPVDDVARADRRRRVGRAAQCYEQRDKCGYECG